MDAMIARRLREWAAIFEHVSVHWFSSGAAYLADSR
jgi:hypothetical protein